MADPGHEAQQKLEASPVGRRQQEAADLQSFGGHLLVLQQTCGGQSSQPDHCRPLVWGTNINAEALTQDVDKDFVQVEGEQRFFKSLEVIAHCPQDVPLKARVQLLPAVTAIRP